MDVVGEDKTKKVRRGERTHGQEGKGLEWKGDLCILKSRCTNWALSDKLLSLEMQQTLPGGANAHHGDPRYLCVVLEMV